LLATGNLCKSKRQKQIRVKFTGRDKEVSEILLEDVKFISTLKVNLFRLAVALKKEAKIHSEVILTKDKKEIVFDSKIKMGSRQG
jgi:hypothetical protein